MAQVCFSAVSFTYPGFDAPSVIDLDLVVADGEFVSVLGESGSGKSTILRLLAGVETPTAGEILIGGENVTQYPPGLRDIATIASHHPLSPHLTVEENIGFSMSVAGLASSVITARVSAVVGVLGLQEFRKRYPRGLSRGERQTVFLARAMARGAGALILDEPLEGLDHEDRRYARLQLSKLQRQTQITTIYVTQDQSEAMTLSDRIAVIDRGRLQQVARPLDLYHYPASLGVAKFFGVPPMNTLTAVMTADGARVGDLLVPVPNRFGLHGGDSVVVGVRAEDLRLLPRGAAVQVSTVEHTGTDAFVHGHLVTDPDRQHVVVRCPARLAPRARDKVFVDVLDDENVLFFDPATGTRL